MDNNSNTKLEDEEMYDEFGNYIGAAPNARGCPSAAPPGHHSCMALWRLLVL